MRGPFAVSIANFFLPGLGYILLGQRVVFGRLLLTAVILQIAQLVIDPLPPYFVAYGSTFFSVMLGTSALILALSAFAYDAFQLAKAKN